MNVQLRHSGATDHLDQHSKLARIVPVLLLLAAATTQAYADDVISSDAASEATVAPEPQIDFRVISTRTCPQDGYSLCSPEQYDYYRLDYDSQWQVA